MANDAGFFGPPYQAAQPWAPHANLPVAGLPGVGPHTLCFLGVGNNNYGQPRAGAQ